MQYVCAHYMQALTNKQKYGMIVLRMHLGEAGEGLVSCDTCKKVGRKIRCLFL